MISLPLDTHLACHLNDTKELLGTNVQLIKYFVSHFIRILQQVLHIQKEVEVRKRRLVILLTYDSWRVESGGKTRNGPCIFLPFKWASKSIVLDCFSKTPLISQNYVKPQTYPPLLLNTNLTFLLSGVGIVHVAPCNIFLLPSLLFLPTICPSLIWSPLLLQYEHPLCRSFFCLPITWKTPHTIG